MATVHPSRMSLVPKDSRNAYPDYPERERRRVRSRSPRDRQGRSRSRDRYLNSDSKRRSSPAYDDYRRSSPRRSPPREESKAPWRQQENMYPNRRGQGERDRPPHVGGSYGGGWTGGGGGSDYMEGCVKQLVSSLFISRVFLTFVAAPSRRQQREVATVNVWPPSPKAPARELCVLYVFLRH